MKGEVVFQYTSKQAEEDGFLFNLIQINKDWEKGLFNYLTTHLLEQGYLVDNKINIPNILDLLNQANQIVRKKSNNFKDFDSFFAGKIEFPNGELKEIFIVQNETGKFTLMLPEDY